MKFTRGEGDHLLTSKTDKDKSSDHAWSPGYLRLWVFVAFLVLFCGMIVALEVLNLESTKHNGLATSYENLHYSWTYGPTAILTIVVAVWSRVEFQAKRSAPWQGMLQEPETADRSVLLDYVSEMQPVALWNSLKNRHFAVASSVTISLILRLLIVFSTGLISLQGVKVTKIGVPVQLLNSFDGTKSSHFDGLASQPFDILNNVAFQNLDYAAGTTSNLTYQQFSMPSNLSNAVLSVKVNAVEANLECEDADLIFNSWGLRTVYQNGDDSEADPEETNINKLVTPSCNVSNLSLDNSDKVRDGNSSVYIFFREATCHGQKGAGAKRIVVTAVDTTAGQKSSNYKNDHTTYATSQNFTVNRSRQLMCKPTYSVLPVNVEVNTTQTLTSAHVKKETGPQSTLKNLTAWGLADKAIAYGAPTHGSIATPDSQADRYYVTDNSTMYLSVALAMRLTGFGNDTSKMFEGDNLRLATTKYYRAITAQLMNSALSKEDNSMITGNATVIENRLLVTQVSLRLMEACLALLVLLVIAIIFLSSSRNISPWNPHKLSSMAAILAHSDALHALLEKSGASSLDTIRGCLTGRTYFTQPGPSGFAISTTERAHDDDESRASIDTTLLWKPLPSLVYRVIVFVVIVMVIIAIEVTLHFSNVQDGLGDAATDSYVHYAWTFTPALVMILLSLPIMSLDFNTRSVAPYFDLKKPEGSTFQGSMSLDLLDNLGIFNIYHSIHTRKFAILATTLATMVGSVLTIVTSGLFVSRPVPVVKTMGFVQKSSFNHNASDFQSSSGGFKVDGNSDIVEAGYIILNNMSFPQWTYGSFVFPELSSNESLGEYPDFSSADIHVPALTTTFDCQTKTTSELKPNLTTQMFDDGNWEIGVQLLVAPCNNKSATVEQKQLMKSVPPNSYFAQTVDVNCGVDGYSGSYTPRIAFVWGHVGQKDADYVAALQCNVKMATVETITRFTLPQFEIDPDHPPVANESLAKPEKNFIIPYVDADGITGDSQDGYSAFFKALVSGKYGFPEEYLGSSDQSAQVVKAIKAQYGALVAQIMNFQARNPANTSLPNTPLSGNATNPSRLRVVQDAASTHTLAALLATMLVLSIIGSVLMNTDHVLPKNPGSIAAMASLLADSNFLDHFRSLPASRDPNDGSLARTLFSNCRFHLGWLDAGSPPESDEPTESVGARGNKEIFTIYLVEGDKNGEEQQHLPP